MRLWDRWVGVCTERETGETLAAFRILIGAVLLNDGIRTLLSGAVGPLFLPESAGGLLRPRTLHWLVVALGGRETEVVTGLFGAAPLLALGLLLGVGGRWTALLTLQVHLALRSLSHHVSGGYDLVLSNGLWLLFLSSCTATWSVDCRVRTGRWSSDRLVWALPRTLLVLQLVVIYTATGWGKRGFGWFWPYDGLHYSLLRVGYPRFDLGWLDAVPWATRLGTVVTWYWEALFGVIGVWFAARRGWLGARADALARRFDLRGLWLGIGVALHGGIWATMDIGPFSGATVAYYAAFVDPTEWRKLVQGFGTRRRSSEA